MCFDVAEHPTAAVEIHHRGERAGAAFRSHDANRDLTLWATRDEAVFAIGREFLNFARLRVGKHATGVFDRQLVDLRTTFGSQPIQEGLRVRFHDGIHCHAPEGLVFCIIRFLA